MAYNALLKYKLDVYGGPCYAEVSYNPMDTPMGLMFRLRLLFDDYNFLTGEPGEFYHDYQKALYYHPEWNPEDYICFFGIYNSTGGTTGSHKSVPFDFPIHIWESIRKIIRKFGELHELRHVANKYSDLLEVQKERFWQTVENAVRRYEGAKEIPIRNLTSAEIELLYPQPNGRKS